MQYHRNLIFLVWQYNGDQNDYLALIEIINHLTFR